MMMDNQELDRQLNKWDDRRRKAEIFLWLPRGLLVGLLAAVLVAAIARFRPLLTNQEVAIMAAGLLLISALISLITLLLRRRSLDEQAHFVDRRLNLSERAGTAVEISSGRLATTPELADRQLADTLTALNGVEAKKAMPLTLHWPDVAIILVALLLLIAALLLPNPQAGVLAQRHAISTAIADQVAALETLQREILNNPTLTGEQQELLLEPIEGALEELQTGDLSREQAVAVLSEAEADFRELGEANSTEALRQTLQEAGQGLAENSAGQSLGQALQNGDLAAASSAANQLADNIPGLNPEEQAALADDLAAAAAALGEVDPQLAAELSRAAEALRNGDEAAAQQALREAAGTLQERAQEQAAAQQSAAAAEQLGQGREAVAQAGAAQGQSSASSSSTGPTDGQDGDSQQGEGESEGSGSGDSSGSGSAADQAPGPGAPGPGGGHAESVYAPDFVDLSGEEGVDIELPAECIADPDSCGALLSEIANEFGDEQSLVPYDQVFGDYRDAAYQALDDDYIPLGLKSFIRDYFSSLEP